MSAQPTDVTRLRPPFSDLVVVSLKLWIANTLIALLFFGLGALALFALSFGGLVLAIGGAS